MQDFHDVGIHLPYGATGEVRTTCPQCDNKSLSVKISDGIWYCHYCGWTGGLRSPRNGHLPSRPVARKPAEPNQKAEQAIKRVWRESRPITDGDPVHRYLKRRGLNFSDLSDLPSILRYHARLAYSDGDNHWTHHPAMVVPVSNPQGEPVSLHRTFLTKDGRKADVAHPKKLMTPANRGATRGGAVRLYPTTNEIGVSEGIETSLAVRLSIGLPVWATVSAIGMADLVIPDSVRTVVIFADHDKNEVGQRSAKYLARRMLLEGRQVKILIPDELGDDWADVVAKGVVYVG